MPAGRPSTYTPELAEEFCRLLCSRNEEKLDDRGNPAFHTVRTVCKELGIAESSAYDWLHQHPEFSEQYMRAREKRASLVAEEILEIVDGEPDPARARVRMDARKWYAGKLSPKVWGEKIMGDPNNPVVVENKDSPAVAEIRSRLDRLATRLAEGASDRVDQP